jgi:hypothetical protein
MHCLSVHGLESFALPIHMRTHRRSCKSQAERDKRERRTTATDPLHPYSFALTMVENMPPGGSPNVEKIYQKKVSYQSSPLTQCALTVITVLFAPLPESVGAHPAAPGYLHWLRGGQRGAPVGVGRGRQPYGLPQGAPPPLSCTLRLHPYTAPTLAPCACSSLVHACFLSAKLQHHCNTTVTYLLGQHRAGSVQDLR